MSKPATLTLLLAAALALAAPALADGDPASDFLIGQKVFLPFDDKIPAQQQGQLTGLVAAANRAGYPIRVAVIGSSYDLGSVEALWREPKQYAKFLGVELSFAYKGPLLVAMPNGFGFNHPKHSTAADERILAGIPVGGGGSGLAAAAITAVERLAAAHGVTVTPPAVARPHSTTGSDRIHLVIGIAALLAAAVAVRWLIRRRQRRRRLA